MSGVPQNMEYVLMREVEVMWFNSGALNNLSFSTYPLLSKFLGISRWSVTKVPMKPQGDKRTRLQVVAHIKNGTVLLPRTGFEDLLGQVFNLGIESHDDLCDGLSYLL
jgi:hypothetical protein